MLPPPDAKTLSDFTQQVMRNEGLLSSVDVKLFPGPTPIHHVIYVIKENRSYDQVFGDLERAGNGEPADGDPSLAIFGAGEAAQRPGGPSQNISPNARALALRFGLLDRFFVNSEASPDGHNWATATLLRSDYVDKAFRWNYSYRGRLLTIFKAQIAFPVFGRREISLRRFLFPPPRGISKNSSAVMSRT